ncbi:MAG TPA: pectin acetylesterase-family hydrolase [Thermoanaerobaculia bacterium]|nr:pectin acetylesterase-family hydrolase [Thermoanaerobaculia bacterium]
MLATVVFTLAAAAAPISSVLPCGATGTVGGLGAGIDLARYTIDTSKFPNAVCNDGTPGVFYYAPATREEDRNKWFIFLQGGGGCRDGQSCAERWCHVNTNYGMDKMTSSLTKPFIRGNGFLDPRPDNHFGSWNRVLIFYCSSDAWRGTKSGEHSATAGSTTVTFTLQFRGSQIIDAVLDTLRNDVRGSRRHAVRHSVETDAVPAWPDLDSATHVLFAGSSAGGVGARSNADRVGAKLRATNPNLVDYRALFDASQSPESEKRDFTRTTYCAKDPRGCSYASFFAAEDEHGTDTFGARRDESCLAWHAANKPGTEWYCEDIGHVTLYHVTSPFFIHQDLQDPQVGGEYVDANFGTMTDYGAKLDAELHALPVPEEPRAATPGIFAPQCTDHESVTNDTATFDVRVGGLSYYDTVWNWWTGAQPQQVIRPFTQPGKAPGCPPS